MKNIIRFIYRLIRPKKTKYPLTLTFYKDEYGDWYIDLPKYPGPKAALQMVANADSLCGHLARGKNRVSILLDIESFDKNEKILKLVRLDEVSGAWYDYETLGTFIRFWLRNVTLYVLGSFPEILYIKVID